MNCKHFGECGACVVYEDGYASQLQKKLEVNKERFFPLYSNEIELFASQESHYRNRAEFRIWHVEDRISYAMSRRDKSAVLIEECPQVNEHVASLMPKLLQRIEQSTLAHKLFGIDFLSSSDGEIVATLLYHKALTQQMQEEMQKIAHELGVSLIGRSRKEKFVTHRDCITEKLEIFGEVYLYEHVENSFTQPNARINEKMIEWIVRDVAKDEDILELYCGAGNFTIPFAKRARKVLATEISKSSISAAKNNMALNGVSNISFVRMSVEEFLEALEKKREFVRMQHVDLASYDIKRIFVDPPRSGLGASTAQFCARYEQILYISCNPLTLFEDLQILSQTHTIESMALFDQFPYTHHVEMGVKLSRKNGDGE